VNGLHPSRYEFYGAGRGRRTEDGGWAINDGGRGTLAEFRRYINVAGLTLNLFANTLIC